MVSGQVYSVVSVVSGAIVGLCLPAVIQAALAKIFGGDVSLEYAVSFRPLEVEFRNISQMSDRQIRVASGFKLLIPVLLFIYLIVLFPQQNRTEYAVLAALISGTSGISGKDLLALENPRDWSLLTTKAYFSQEKSSVFPEYLPGIRSRPITYLSLLIISIFILIGVLELQGTFDYISNSDTPPYTVSTISQIIGGAGSLIFSILLVILYDKQASISGFQSVVQDEQKDLMRRDREPRLSGPYNFRFWGAYPSTQSDQNPSTKIDAREIERSPNPNSVQFFQTNAGEGLAQNFRLRVSLNIEHGPHEGLTAVCAVQRMDRFPLHKFGESDIQGGEKDVEFMTEELKLSFTDPESDMDYSFDTFDFRQGINKLYDQGTYKITIILELEWEDEFEEKYEEQVYHITSDITPGMDLLDFIQ
ncbi:hypothetical protein [Haloplanus natans]|uniref:hypothetical protein n=1 Tax=Haloplanus natans TaxID=376171 RepID=UPI0012F70CF7|nr:hypothetical protein [Haloplanus natans]